MGRRGDLDPRRVRKSMYALVQAQRCQHEMRQRLNDFNASKQPPTAPREFTSLQEFLDFYGRKREYEDGLKALKAKLDYAKDVYERTSRELVEILPENTPLHFTYKDSREDPEGTEFVIVNNNRRLLGGGGQAKNELSITRREPVGSRKPWSEASGPRGGGGGRGPLMAALVAAVVGYLALVRRARRRGWD